MLALNLVCISASRQWCSNVSGPRAALDPAYVFHLLFSLSDTTWETLTLHYLPVLVFQLMKPYPLTSQLVGVN